MRFALLLVGIQRIKVYRNPETKHPRFDTNAVKTDPVVNRPARGIPVVFPADFSGG
jgi:hypothetical protein